MIKLSKRIGMAILIFTLFIAFSGCVSEKPARSNNDMRDTDRAGTDSSKDEEISVKDDNANTTKDSEKDLGDSIKTYTDKRYKFSVDYPENLKTEITETSIDSGIIIYFDDNKDESIYVYGQSGHISLPYADGVKKEEFITDSGLRGTLYILEHNGTKEMDLILGEGFLGANVSFRIDIFKQYEEQIFKILKSIRSTD